MTATMRMTASDFVSYHRPTRCDLRVFLRHQQRAGSRTRPLRCSLASARTQAREKPSGDSRDVRRCERRLSRRAGEEDGRRHRQRKFPSCINPLSRANEIFGGTDVEIVGVPDFLILDGDGYLIRDSKMARRIDEDNHPEILLQVQLYGWLFERSCGAAPKGLQVHAAQAKLSPFPTTAGQVRFAGIGAAPDHQATDGRTL